MSKIDDKHAELRRDGFDLGPALGPEQDAGHGGRFRRYQHGNIYYHPVMGSSAREVHGGILATYLAHGGPGPHPATGQRHLGFPVSDETSAAEGGRLSKFEWGEIYWVPGRGGVVVHGAIQRFIGNYLSRFQRRLGLPLTDNMPIAGGEAVYFERGCIYFNTALPGDFLVSHIDPPLLGRPAILDSDSPGDRRFPRLITYPVVSNELYNAIGSTRPALFSELWDRRLSLRPVVAPGRWREPLPLVSKGTRRFDQSVSESAVGVNLEIAAPSQLSHRTLYDLNLNLANNAVHPISAHCYYAAKDWTNFGIFHITDLHLSSRNEGYFARLNALGLQEAGLEYANFQNNFRAFNTYANLLHEKGLADVVLATGDLVDYVFESDGSDNFALFESMIRGSSGSEELRIPIFTIFGNHDYRVNPYKLLFEVEVPHDNLHMKEYPSHNLKPDEALALQGGREPKISADQAVAVLEVDVHNQSGKYNHYCRRINDKENYVVRLGPHYIVMIDTGSDVGVPADADAGTMLTLIWRNTLGSLNEDERQAKAGAPNQGGTGGGINLLRSALSNAGEGLVIVGMHAPPFSPPGGEYPYYIRETQHPVADPGQVPEYLRRRKADSTGWIPSGTPYFKTGLVSKGLDYGIARGRCDEFAEVIAGAGSRPADLVLCGHQHDRTDFRLRWDAGRREVQYFFDFYTENPAAYYFTINNFASEHFAAEEPISLQVRSDAPPQGRVRVVRDHRGGTTVEKIFFDIPPYANPLNSSSDPSAWWRDHRPLVLQTSALGPISPRQRFDPRWRLRVPGGVLDVVVESQQRPGDSYDPLPPQPVNVTFQGFRLIQVRSNAIARIRYITLAELRRRSFVMPWESEGASPVNGAGTGAGGGISHP